MRKAIVRAVAQDTGQGRSTSTDQFGTYQIDDVAPGRYEVTVAKLSFVTLSYGQTRPFEHGKTLDVRSSTRIELDFKLPRGGVIAGRVVNEFGEPAADVRVSAARFQYAQGRRRLMPIGRPAQTNDLGEFRVFGLPPDRYYIAATLSGGIESPDQSAYAPTYYPSTADIASAQSISVTVGGTVSDIAITLSTTRLARVAGTAVDSEGRPVTRGFIALTQKALAIRMPAIGSPVKPDGTFDVPGVPPGDYVARIMLDDDSKDAFSRESFETTLTVDSNNISDLRLVGVRPSVVTGRLVAPAFNVRTFNFSSIQLKTTSAEPDTLIAGGQSRVNDDGTFEIAIPPGTWFVSALGIGTAADLRAKAVRVRGTDVIDEGLDVHQNEDLRDVEIELTAQSSRVAGEVTDAAGARVSEYAVIVFPRDRQRWRFGSRYFAAARPDQDGRFLINSLPPGQYYALALAYIEQGAGTDADFLDRVRDKATEFSINETETKHLDLRLVSGL